MQHVKSNPEAELGVLGTLIINGNPDEVLVKKSMLQLSEHLFYHPPYRELYKFIRKCFDSSQWFDLSSLIGMQLGGQLHETLLNSVQGQLFTGVLLDHHIESLQQMQQLRTQIHLMTKTLRECQAEPTPAIASEIVRSGVNEVSNVAMDKMKEGSTFKEIYEEYILGNFKNDTHVQCGIKQFEEIRNCGLITIAGDSGMGKTFFSIYFMDQLVKYQTDKQFLFFSLEMKRNDIWDRYLNIRLDKHDIDHDDRACQLPDGKVFDHARIDIEYIETIAHLESMNKPLSVIVVDYLGLVTSRTKYEREDLKISDITQRLAALAMNLNCIVIGLTQVNRDASRRLKGDRCPYPSDVADSVGSVRSASLWIGIDRPETYDDSADMKNVFVAKCRKTRYGKNFEATFEFNGGRFRELTARYQPKKTKGRGQFLTTKQKLNDEIGEM